MPTGYTAKLSECEQPFEEFVWSCARAFGALVLMRDDPHDAKVPEKFEASPYYADQVRELRRQIDEWEGSSQPARRAMYESFQASAKRSRDESIAKSKATKVRYEAMLEKARAWEPPSSEHEGLRSFMVKQIEESIQFDCYDREDSPGQSFEVWQVSYGEALSRSLAYSEESKAKEEARTAERNRWIVQLRESVPQPERIA